MSLDSLIPTSPARVKALLLPLGRIKHDRFSLFVETLRTENVVQLCDVSADGRPNRNMFSPLSFPEGSVFYDLTTQAPSESQLAMVPFDMYREALVIIAIADGMQLGHEAYTKRMSLHNAGTSVFERNIRALDQELERLRDEYPKALVHSLLIFEYVAPEGSPVNIPEAVVTLPPIAEHKRTTIKTIMCDISSRLLAEMTTLAKSFEGLNFIDSPDQTDVSEGNISPALPEEQKDRSSRRTSQFSIPALSRSASASGLGFGDKLANRMSLPVFKSGSSSSPPDGGNASPLVRAATPVGSRLSQPPTTFDDIADRSPLDGPNPKRAFPGPKPAPMATSRSSSQDRVAMQGFGSGSSDEKRRIAGKARIAVIVGSLFLQAGLWSSALSQLIDGANLAKTVNDHIWHGKALELILVALILLGYHDIEFLVPTVLLPPLEKGEKHYPPLPDPSIVEPGQPRWLRNLQIIMPDLLDRIIGLYSRASAERLPPLATSEAVIRFSRFLAALHIADGVLNAKSMRIMVLGTLPRKPLTTSARLIVQPSRARITSMLFKAFPPQVGADPLSRIERCVILGAISSVLGSIGYHRKKALVVRELVSVLTAGFLEARTRGAAEVGIHPAAALKTNGLHTNAAGAFELDEADIEYGVDALLAMLCKTFGIVGPYYAETTDMESMLAPPADDSDKAIIGRILRQSAARFYGMLDLKLDILRSCINFSEALPDFAGVLRFSSDLLRTAGSGIAPSARGDDAGVKIYHDEQIRLLTNISKASSLGAADQIAAEYWDEFLIRGIALEPLSPENTPVLQLRSQRESSAATDSTVQEVSPFIYNAFVKETKEKIADASLVAGEVVLFRVTLQNPYDLEIVLEKLKLETQGVELDSAAERTTIGPFRTQTVKVSAVAKGVGQLTITGAIVRVQGCRERRFPIFPDAWKPRRDVKVKALGVEVLDRTILNVVPSQGPKPARIDLNVIAAQPLVVIKSTTLPQASVMILEGEKQVFTMTLENRSKSTPVDVLLFSFQDSTQAPLQAALNNREATPADIYEYELILARKQALKVKSKLEDRYIMPGGTATIEFEILGKAGLTHASIQVDYGYVGVPIDEVGERFYTRQVRLDMRVTVNASIEVGKVDVMPLTQTIPRPLWTPSGGSVDTEHQLNPDEYCLLALDLRNAWPAHMSVHLEIELSEHDSQLLVVDEHILPGNISRIVFPMRRAYIEDPFRAIPALNPTRQHRQFVVSMVSPEAERASREMFWYREHILSQLKATWKTLGTHKHGDVDLRAMRLTQPMLDAVRIDEVDIKISVQAVENGHVMSENRMSSLSAAAKSARSLLSSVLPQNTGPSGDTNNANTVLPDAEDSPDSVFHVPVDSFMRIVARISNRSTAPIHASLRLVLALRHRSPGMSLSSDMHARRWPWNGTLQRHLAVLQPGETRVVSTPATTLARGEFEITGCVEETMLWVPPPPPPPPPPANHAEKESDKTIGSKWERKLKKPAAPSRPRSSTAELLFDQMAGLGASGKRDRRVWGVRRPAFVVVCDEDEN